jgi:hypothetical protein
VAPLEWRGIISGGTPCAGLLLLAVPLRGRFNRAQQKPRESLKRQVRKSFRNL